MLMTLIFKQTADTYLDTITQKFTHKFIDKYGLKVCVITLNDVEYTVEDYGEYDGTRKLMFVKLRRLS